MSSYDYFHEHSPGYVWSHPWDSVKEVFGLQSEASAYALDKAEDVVEVVSGGLGDVAASAVKGALSPFFGNYWWLAVIGIIAIVIFAIFN